MLINPVSLTPCYLYATLTVVCGCVYAGIIPAPGWLVVLSLYLAFVNGLFTLACGLRWVIDGAVRTACLKDSLNPEARISEAIGRMNDKQLMALGYVLRFEDVTEAISLPNGEAISPDTLARIADNLNGDALRPERSYQVDRQPIRAAHDALERAAIIEPARGNAPPRIKDPQAFEKILQLAKVKL